MQPERLLELPRNAEQEHPAGTREQAASVRRFLDRALAGDAEASDWLMQQFYPSVYRYLLYLAGNPDTAADLTQETFAHAWRGLKTFEGRVPLQYWLYRIAHREFLQSLRRRRSHLSFDQMGEPLLSPAVAWTDAAELRTIIGNLPVQEREVIVLHYFEGYDYAEVSGILGVPVGRVRHRLSEARARLRQAIGEGDMSYLNRSYLDALRHWTWLPLDELADLEADLLRKEPGESPVCLTAQEAEVVDLRLERKVSVLAKGTALGDLCRNLQEESGIGLRAAPAIAEEKVTLLCRDQPLCAVMRALSSLFGFTWRRRAAAGAYVYELSQRRHAQMLEEALCQRDRNAALLALDSEMQRYRRYLALSPAEARSGLGAAGPENRAMLEALTGSGWAAVHLYFRLPPAAVQALHQGQELVFCPNPNYGQWPLLAAIEQGLIELFPQLPALPGLQGYPRSVATLEHPGPYGRTQVIQVDLKLTVLEPGQVRLEGGALFTAQNRAADPTRVECIRDSALLAVGISHHLPHPGNRATSSRRTRDSAHPRRITLEPRTDREEQTASAGGAPASGVTTAEVLEALHRATGLNIAGDYFTRFYAPDTVTLRQTPLAEALESLSEALRVRWNREEDWLQCRSAGFFYDRAAEVPHRLLSRWAESRRKNGFMTLEDLVEVAGLSDTQLDAPGMSEGAQAFYGLEEWDLARSQRLRPHWRFLGNLPPDLRAAAWSELGLRWEQAPLALQPLFLMLATSTQAGERPEQDLAFTAVREMLASQGKSFSPWRPQHLAGATLHVATVQPDEYRGAVNCGALGHAEGLSTPGSAGAKREIAFIYRFGNPEMGFWRREVRSGSTACQHDPQQPFA